MRIKKNINIEIGERIQKARENAGYTQEKLSELLSMSTNHLSAIECGASGCSIENLQKICSLLNVSADRILFANTTPSGEMVKILYQLEKIKPEYLPYISNILSDIIGIPFIAE